MDIIETSCQVGGALEKELVDKDLLDRVTRMGTYFLGYIHSRIKRLQARLPVTFVIYHMEPPLPTILEVPDAMDHLEDPWNLSFWTIAPQGGKIVRCWYNTHMECQLLPNWERVCS